METSTEQIIHGLGHYFYKIAERSQDVMWVKSADLDTQLYINPAYESVWKRPCNTLYENPHSWIESVCHADRDRIEKAWISWYTNCDTGDIFDEQYSITDAESNSHLMHEIAFPIFNEGYCIGYAGVARELTGHSPQPHEPANQMAAYFELFANQSAKLFWVQNLDSSFQYVSPACQQVIGLSQTTLYNNQQSWQDIIHPNDRTGLTIYDKKKQFEQNQSKKIVHCYRIRDQLNQTKWIKDITFPIHGKDGLLTGLAGIAEDITTDMEKDRDLTQAKKNTQKANQSKSNFLAMMSHELRTPLNAILGMAQILDKSNLNFEQKDQLEVIIQSGKNLLSMLGNLLDFAKLEVGQIEFKDETCNLTNLVNQLIAEVKSKNNKSHIPIHFHCEKNVPQAVITDKERLQQILHHLLLNAFKFTHEGSITIRINCLQSTPKDTVLCFTVEDTGVGIEQNELNQIFNKFNQPHSVFNKKQDGLGIGLAIVKELIERMGGSIAVSSELGYGSQFSCIIPFHLELPRIETKGENRSQTEDSSEKLTFDIDVLVVEDNPINQKIIKIMLEQMGCRVELANCGQVAIDKATHYYDLIFMDIGLPDMDGFETTRHIRSNLNCRHRTPIVAMTAHVFNDDRQKCFQVGMDEIIAKPILRENLIAILRRWSDENKHIS